MKKKIVIIGGGVSGLCAGIFGQKNGFDTMILEKNNNIGGNLTGWYRNNLYIDNCIHWFNGSKENTRLNNLWKKVGAIDSNTKFYQSENFFESELNGQTIRMNKNIEITKNDMLKICPEDEKIILKFISCVKAYDKLSSNKSLEKIFTGVKMFLAFGNKTLGQVSKMVKSPLLKRVFTDYIPAEYSVYVLILAYASFAFGDGKVFVDGSLNMAKRLEQKYKELGGKVILSTEVKKISYEDKRVNGVVLNDDKKITGDYYVSCTDAKITFGKFLPEILMPKKLFSTYNNRKYFPIISSFHIAFKSKIKIDLPDSVVFECEPIQIGKTTYTRLMLKNYSYLPQNKEIVLQIFLLQKEEDYDFWKGLNSAQYQSTKKEIVEKIENEITKRFKELENNIEFLDCWTPLTYTRYFGAYKGSYMSFGVTKKIRTGINSKIKKFNNFYLASQWQSMFGGLPNALGAGKNCIEQILKDEKKFTTK